MQYGACLATWTDVFTKERYLSNELWRWGALFGLLLVALTAGRIVGFLLQRQASRLKTARQAHLPAALLQSLVGPVGLVLLSGALYLAGGFMMMAKPTTIGEGEAAKEVVTYGRLLDDSLWVNIAKTIAILAAGWFIFRMVDAVELVLKRWTSRTDTKLDDQLVPLIRKTLRVFIVIVAALFIAQNVFQWDIGALIAGLGIGGLAVALAAQDTVSNLFGSVTIFADRPFHLGDRVVIQGHDGIVEEVGFRSTRIRTLAGHLVVIPNSVIAKEAVENIGRRPYIRRVLNVTIPYDTPPEKVQRGVEILRAMLDARKDRFPADFPPRVFFNDFNAASLNLIVFYWHQPPDYWAYEAFNHDFNMELLRRFNEEGIEFAFPTQTLYVKQDSPLKAELAGPQRHD